MPDLGLARKRFSDTELSFLAANGSNILTWKTPAITTDQEFRFNTPMTYFVFAEGATYYVRSGLTQSIITSGSDIGTVINTVLALMTSTGGIIHLAAGAYSTAVQITIPQHSGKSITIEGEGWRNTTITWTGGADATKYIIESFSTNSSGWQIVTLKDFQVVGGSATNNRLVHGLHLGRTDPAAVATYNLHNFRVSNCVSAQIVGSYIQDSFWYFVYAESTGSTPTAILDLTLAAASHCNMYGCNIGAITVNESRLNAYGGTMQYLNYEQVSSYPSTISGTFFDPIPVGFTHQIQVGSTGAVVGVTFVGIGFSADTNTPASHRYFYINNARNVTITGTKFMTSSTVATFIEVTSSASGTTIYYPNQEALSKITNNSTTTNIFNPYLNNILTLNNPSGTLGAILVDNFTNNRIELANTAVHLIAAIKSSSGSAKFKINSRNAANSADVTRLQVGSIANQGSAPIELLEAIDQTTMSAPTDPAAGHVRVYPKVIDANNDGLFIKVKKAGAVVEVQIA